MRYLFIAFLFVSLFGHSQGIEPSSFQGNPNKSGFLKSVTLNVDDFGDTTYLYVHVDSLSVLDSIYLQGDSLILLKNGSGQVYKNRIHTGYTYPEDVPNPKKYDIYVNSYYTSYWYDGSDWVIFDGDTDPFNEGSLGLQNIATNIIGLNSSTNSSDIKKFVGLNGIEISTNEIDTINIGIDTTLFSGETQYLNPYVVTGDTTGFYLTVAQDTVLFVNTIDTAAYCCPPSLSGDTLFIAENYVQLPKENLIGGWGITATESPAYTWNLIADSSQVATQYDLSLVSGSQTLSIDSTNRVFTVSISGGNSVKFKDTGGIDSTTVVNSYGTTITESPANQWNIKVDSSKFATVYDISQVSGGGLPDYALLDHGSTAGNTQTLTLYTWNTLTFSGAQESDSGVINADASTEEIDFVVAGTYRIEYFATWISNVSSYTTAGIYSDNGAAQLTKSQVQVRTQTGFLSTTVSKVFYHTAIAGETIKFNIYPDATHTSVGIYSYLIATKVN